MPVFRPAGGRDLWLLDLNSRSRNLLDFTGYSIEGGFHAGDATVALLSGDKDTRLLVMRGASMFVTDDLNIYSFYNDPRIMHVSTQAGKAVFALAKGGQASSEVSAGFYWDGHDFYRFADLDESSELAANADGNRICEVVWEGKHQILVVKELHLPK